MTAFHAHGDGTILVTAHLANWEWCGFVLTCVLSGPGIAVYRPLKNPKADRLMKRHRLNSGLDIVPMRSIVRMLTGGAAATHYVLLIADQSPDPDNAQWLEFMGVPTAFFKGPAVLAQRYDMPVYFIYLERTGRHTYRMHLEPLSTEPKSVTQPEIIQRYAHRLEALIRDKPEHWLWTHRRWKHMPPSSIGLQR
jgi:Kdo2-lipid IVA lauroyltransferase/acyltransferase